MNRHLLEDLMIDFEKECDYLQLAINKLRDIVREIEKVSKEKSIIYGIGNLEEAKEKIGKMIENLEGVKGYFVDTLNLIR